MWRFKKKEQIKENAYDEYSMYLNREKEANKKIKEKNIVLWDYVLCDREYDWIYQWKWKYTWEVKKDRYNMNVRYYVEFERNWMKYVYPINIDNIKKVEPTKRRNLHRKIIR